MRTFLLLLIILAGSIGWGIGDWIVDNPGKGIVGLLGLAFALCWGAGWISVV